MSDRTAIKLEYSVPGILILPEILKIIETMVDAYNDFDNDKAPVKMCSDQVEGSIVRYQSYDSKDDLLEAIVANCPVGLRITNKK